MSFRGVSVVIGSIIVFAFLFIAIIPLLLGLLKSSTQETILASVQASIKLKESIPSLNITLDMNESKDSQKVYNIKNIAAEDKKVTLLVVEDNQGQVYIVRPGACVDTWCTVGSASISVRLINGALREASDVILSPGGLIKVIVYNGRILGAYTGVLGYSKAHESRVVEKVYYAEVAGSIKTVFLNMSLFTTLEDLLSGRSGVILVTDPSANQSDSSVLYSGVMRALCNRLGLGAFQSVTSDWVSVDGMLFYNIHPTRSSFVVGGLSTRYGKVFNASILVALRSLVQWNTDLPAVIAAYYEGTWFALIVKGDMLLILESNTLLGPLPTILDYFKNLFNVRYRLVIDSRVRGSSSLSTKYAEVILDVFIDKYGHAIGPGLLAVAGQYIIYCKPGDFIVNPSTTSGLMITLKKCPAVKWSRQKILGYVENVVIFMDNYGNWTGSEGTRYYGYDENALIENYYNYVFKKVYRLTDTNVETQTRFARFKLMGETTELTFVTYDGFRNMLHRGVDAFGYYYYSGADLNGIVNHGIVALTMVNAKLKLFVFTPNSSAGGIDPYFVFADTDGNGLREMVFMTEDAGPSLIIYGGIIEYRNNDYDWGGCLDWSVKPLYLKFVGRQYMVNGSKYAQVSIQIRYTFHDNAGADTDEVEDPKKYIFSFQIMSINGSIFMTADYIYQELDDLEDTWPPNQNWDAESVFLLVPNDPNLYTISFSFCDPYRYVSNSYKDDIDFTVAVEWIGLWRLRR